MKLSYTIFLQSISFFFHFLKALSFGHLAQVLLGLVFRKYNFHQMLNSFCKCSLAENFSYPMSQSENPPLSLYSTSRASRVVLTLSSMDISDLMTLSCGSYSTSLPLVTWCTEIPKINPQCRPSLGTLATHINIPFSVAYTLLPGCSVSKHIVLAFSQSLKGMFPDWDQCWLNHPIQGNARCGFPLHPTPTQGSDSLKHISNGFIF